MGQILGVEKLNAQLKDLTKALGTPFLRRAARQGATLTRNEARRIAPFTDRTGVGRKSITIAERRAPAGVATFQVGFSCGKKKSGFYLRFIEGGARPHTITPSGGAMVRFPSTSKRRTPNRSKVGRALAIPIGQSVNPIFGSIQGGNVIFRRSAHHPGISARPFLNQAARRHREKRRATH